MSKAFRVRPPRTLAFSRRRRAAAIPFVALLSAGCASSSGSDGPSEGADGQVTAAREAGECVRGVVVSEGVDIAPRTWVDPADGPRVELLGTMAGNVRLLTGTTVRACGPGLTPGGELEVTEVEVVEVDGMPATLGVLRDEGTDGWSVEPLGSGEATGLRAVSGDLRRAAGTVVWVAGPIESGRLSVRSYGVLEGWR
ncbi:MAG: hypothetical protein U5R14_00975 [Gemmatimonadota bacterium]|nr:hypothetical protein [Gemmatimonadota bacterium]